MTTVVQLKTNERTAKAKARRANRVTKAVRRMHSSAAILGAVAIVLMGLSLTHLARGIEMVCHCSATEGWALAVGVDLGFIALEIASITVMERVRRKVDGLIHHTLIGLMLGSSALNALAGLGGEGWMTYAGAAMMAAIPLVIFRITRVATSMWLG